MFIGNEQFSIWKISYLLFDSNARKYCWEHSEDIFVYFVEEFRCVATGAVTFIFDLNTNEMDIRYNSIPSGLSRSLHNNIHNGW